MIVYELNNVLCNKTLYSMAIHPVAQIGFDLGVWFHQNKSNTRLPLLRMLIPPPGLPVSTPEPVG